MKRLRFPAEQIRPKAAVCPDWLRHEGVREEWTRVAPILTRMGLLDETMAISLGVYCELVHQVQQISAEVDRVGTEKAVSTGLWQASLDTGRELLSYCEAMLLTPASRGRSHGTGRGA